MRMGTHVMNFGQVNVNNLLNKVDFVSVYARDHKLDAIAVSESWLIQSV